MLRNSYLMDVRIDSVFERNGIAKKIINSGQGVVGRRTKIPSQQGGLTSRGLLVVGHPQNVSRD